MQQGGRKKIGWKGDIIIRSTEVSHSMIKKYEAGKVGVLIDIHSNKTVLRESSLKLSSVLLDMVSEVILIWHIL